MKLFLGVLFAFVVAIQGQEDVTVTEGLLQAQRDLALGHEFFETIIFINRGQISTYIQFINTQILNSHIDTYRFIKELGLETIAQFEAIPRTPSNGQCLDGVLNRWDLQVVRYGHRLATCVNGAYRLIAEWNEFLNNLHETAQGHGNQVQNLGVMTLANTETFDGREDLAANSNRRFRILLKTFLGVRRLFDDFLENVSTDVLDTIADLISCDVTLEEEFALEVTRDLQLANNCADL